MSQRKSIFLESIDGYSKRSKSLKGHTQFDQIKNKLVVKMFMEGLANEEYGVDILLSDNKSVNIGTVFGQNKTDKIFQINNNILEINAILVYPINEPREIILAGFLKDKDKIDIKETNNSRTSQMRVKKAADIGYKREDILIEKETNITSNQKSDINEKSTYSDSVKQGETVIDKNLISENESEKFSSTRIIEEKNDIDSQVEETEKLKGGVYNNQIFYLWENIETLDMHLKSANPFMQPIPRHKWWSVKEYDSEIQYYCILYNGYLMPMIYPFMNYKNISMMDKNWVFGAVMEEYNSKEVLKYFVYGIPGRFYMQEQPFKGSTGYLYWQSQDEVNKDPIGYWLLYVDVHTGKIVIPRRPVKPPLNKDIMHNNV